jgi:hypothetical protein
MSFWVRGAVEILLAMQASYASVSGVVRDSERGRPLAGAVVELSDLECFAVTDEEGVYLFQDVPAGPQHIAVSMLGFTSRTLHALVPREGRLHINIDLQPDPIPVAGIEGADSTSFPDRSLTAAAVHVHPLLAEPDFFQALAGGEVTMQPEAPSGIHVRGGSSDQTAYLLDGIPVFSPYHAAGTFSAWNPDALSQLRLSDGPSTAGLADALSGVVTAQTRRPGARIGVQGSVSTTQARFTVDGPLGSRGAGYLFSLRRGFSGFIFPKDEPSYLNSEIGDWLAKLEVPVLGGRARLLAYDSENEIGAAASVEMAPAAPAELEAARNDFAWHSQSLGGEWQGSVGGARLLVRGWRATGDANALWSNDAGPESLRAERRDEGIMATVELGRRSRRTTFGLRARDSHTLYRIGESANESASFALRQRTPVVAPFIVQRASIGRRTELDLAVVAPVADGRAHLGPRGRLRSRVSNSLTLSGSYSRTHQFAQSLRNAESIVGHIFPVDMFVGAGAAGLPVARSDEGVVGLEYRPLAGFRLAAQGYARGFRRLALVAPVDADPYAITGFVEGSGRARGFSFDAALSGARYGLIIAYGFQHTRLAYGDTTYVPEHGSSHLIDAGLIVFPSVTSSIRVGITSVLGRRTTRLVGPIEWEACNILDRGCEFAGSPQDRDEPLGASPLPAYVRMDLGLRKHWHLSLGGRDELLGAFATITNVLGRTNVFALANDLETGERVQIEMRPRAPLVVGIDWRF